MMHVWRFWAQGDSFFAPPGAEAFKRDVPNAVVNFFDTGYFALETNLEDIASAILEMLMRGWLLIEEVWLHWGLLAAA
jgi:hypothetical protein